MGAPCASFSVSFSPLWAQERKQLSHGGRDRRERDRLGPTRTGPDAQNCLALSFPFSCENSCSARDEGRPQKRVGKAGAPDVSLLPRKSRMWRRFKGFDDFFASAVAVQFLRQREGQKLFPPRRKKAVVVTFRTGGRRRVLTSLI